MHDLLQTFLRPKSGADDRILQINLDGTQGIRHVKAKVVYSYCKLTKVL